MQNAALTSPSKIPLIFVFDIVHGYRTVFYVQSLGYYIAKGKYVVEPGRFELMVGNNSSSMTSLIFIER